MPPLRFTKQQISSQRYESAAAFDVNNDGVLDIVCGAWWYEGPDFKRKHPVGEVRAEGEYYDDFSTLAMDINGNGYLDFVTGGWWGNTIRWRENPKGDPEAEWQEHVIAEVGNVETTRAWDVDGDGELEIVPNTPGGPLRYWKLVRNSQGKATGAFSEHMVLDQPQGHGFGFGDINGDGREDFVLHNGWVEAPAKRGGKWTFHPEFDLGSASCPVVVTDVNGNGLADLIVGQSHAYGLDWWEQRVSSNGTRTWTKHPIDPYNSQYHDLWWGDIDGDGQSELVTGKRYRAHCGNDPGANDPVGTYYFKWNGESFAKQVVDFGPSGEGKGCGIHFHVVDIDGNGRLDIVAPGKDGLVLLRNQGSAGSKQ